MQNPFLAVLAIVFLLFCGVCLKLATAMGVSFSTVFETLIFTIVWTAIALIAGSRLVPLSVAATVCSWGIYKVWFALIREAAQNYSHVPAFMSLHQDQSYLPWWGTDMFLWGSLLGWIALSSLALWYFTDRNRY